MSEGEQVKKNIIKIITILLVISLYSCGEKSTLNYEEYFLEAGFFEKTIKSEINFEFDESIQEAKSRIVLRGYKTMDLNLSLPI